MLGNEYHKRQRWFSPIVLTQITLTANIHDSGDSCNLANLNQS